MPWGPAPTTELVVPSDAASGAPQVRIGAQVPPDLQTFWQNGSGANAMTGSGLPANFPFTLIAAAFFDETFNGTPAYNYLGLIDGTNGVNRYAYLVIGSSLGDVYAAFAISRPAGGPTVVLNGSNISANRLDIVNALAVLAGGAFQIDGVDQGRGLVGFTGSQAAPVNSVSSTAEISVLTIAGCVFKNQRAFRIELRGFHNSTAAQDVRYRARTVSLTGQIIADFGDIPIVSTASGGEGFYAEELVRNVTGADVTHDVLTTMSLLAGAVTVNLTSRNSSPVYMRITDIGPASQYPQARAIT